MLLTPQGVLAVCPEADDALLTATALTQLALDHDLVGVEFAQFCGWAACLSGGFDTADLPFLAILARDWTTRRHLRPAAQRDDFIGVCRALGTAGSPAHRHYVRAFKVELGLE